MSKLDEAIESNIGSYKHASNVMLTQLPDLSAMTIQDQFYFCFNLNSHEIHDPTEEAFTNNEISFMDGAPSDDVESSAFDKFLGVYVELSGDDEQSKVLARVKDRKRDHDGRLIGSSHPNPILNTLVYDVETPGGNLHEYTANVIAEHLWNQVDDNGYDYRLLYEIIGHRRSKDAVKIQDGFYTTQTGVK